MEITNLGVNNSSLAPQQPVETPAPATGEPTAPSMSTSCSTYTPSAELQRLLDQVHAESDVRPDRVQAASLRLQQGYYHTPASIDQTAQAMLHSGD